MSKLGKKPIPIPQDTKVKFEDGKLILTGPKGSRELTLNDKIFTATIADDKNLLLKLIKNIITSQFSYLSIGSRWPFICRKGKVDVLAGGLTTMFALSFSCKNVSYIFY